MALAVQFLDLVVVVPVVQVVLRAGGSGPRLQLFDQRDVLGGVLVAEAGVAAGAFSPGVGAHHTGGEPM